MICEGDFESGQGLPQFVGQFDVRCGRTGVSGRMVVRKNHGNGTAVKGFADNAFDVYLCQRLTSFADFEAVQKAAASFHEQAPAFFFCIRSKQTPQHGGSVPGVIDYRPFVDGQLICQPPSQFHSGSDGRCLCHTDSVNFAHSVKRHLGQIYQRMVCGDKQSPGHVYHIHSACPRMHQNRQQFSIGKSSRPGRKHFFSGKFVLAQFRNFHTLQILTFFVRVQDSNKGTSFLSLRHIFLFFVFFNFFCVRSRTEIQTPTLSLRTEEWLKCCL